jgi:hypothetical protein
MFALWGEAALLPACSRLRVFRHPPLRACVLPVTPALKSISRAPRPTTKPNLAEVSEAGQCLRFRPERWFTSPLRRKWLWFWVMAG